MRAGNKVIKGTNYAQSIERDLSQRLSSLTTKPELAVVLVGEDPASRTYIEAKRKACQRLDIDFSLHPLEQEENQSIVRRQVEELNQSQSITAILIQLPLPSQLDQRKLIAALDPAKDADGLHPLNLGRLFHKHPEIAPATPKAILKLLEETEGLQGKDCTIINDSLLVGKPLALLLLQKGATVNVCHKQTRDLQRHTEQADIVVVGVGQPGFLKPEMIKQGATVIDVGINRTEQGLTGDVDFDRVKDKAGYITPVPGGVGPVTVAMLLDNVVRLQEKKESKF